MPERYLFVCTGNICRSPTAEGVLRAMAARRGLAAEIEVASAGLGSWHVGAPPDDRSQTHALQRGYDLSAQRARLVSRHDFERHDHVIAMDEEHHERLSALCPPALRHRLERAADYTPSIPPGGVPDPYAGRAADFEIVLDMVEALCAAILASRQPS